MRGRPRLYTSYESEASLLPTGTQRLAMLALCAVLVTLPFNVPVFRSIPILNFLGDDAWIRLTTTVLIFLVAALGLNILTGLAGQVSLGHAFFMGVGAYAAVVVGGTSGTGTWGWDLPIWIWLPASGVVAAAIGIIVSPTAVRVRGLYLGIVTLGLVFIGIHFSRMFPEVAGPGGLGRKWPTLDIRLWKEQDPLVTVSADGKWLWFEATKNQKSFLMLLLLAAFFFGLAKNLARTRTGRALQAIRDRDVAAEVMGVPEAKYKLIAFAISSFFAGVSGALLASFTGQINPEYWDLLLSVQFIAILLIGGVGTTAGAALGTAFVVLAPKFVEEFAEWTSRQAEGGGLFSPIWDSFVSLGAGDFGFITTQQSAPGWPLPVQALDEVIYGVLIVVFLLFEPLGLFGIWRRIRNYWKGWPFTY